MKALITGITGFAGSFLAENLVASNKYEVSGTYLSDNSLSNVESIREKLNLHQVNLQDFEAVNNLISEIKPDVIFHLAALAAAGESFAAPAKFINNNVDAQINLFEAIKSASISPRVLIVSSAEVYGDVDPDNLPIDENTPIRPANPYGVSKVAQDFMGLAYFLSDKIPVIRVRPFNHIGPRQTPSFVVARFAKAIAEMEKGLNEPILKVGNLEAKRDFTDVHDMVQLYVDLIEKGEPGEVYNAGSGHSIKIAEILNKLLSLSTKEIKVEQDQSLIRPIDTPELVCNNTKVKQATGWEPKIEIDQTLKETLDYFRSLS